MNRLAGKRCLIVGGTSGIGLAAAERFHAEGAALVVAGLPDDQPATELIGKVRFINDSKATNADATARALACYPDIFWIAGGKAKEGGIESLGDLFPRIRKAYLIGEAAHEFSRTLDGKVRYEISDTLEHAVASAAAEAQESRAAAPVVLLSPACASYDQFKDFEERGERFRALVAKLPHSHDSRGAA